MKRPRIILADDHSVLLEGLRKLLESEFDLVGVVNDGRTLVSTARKLQPDLIIADISMPSLNGIEASRQIRKSCPSAKILILTMHADTAYVEEAFRAGVHGYVVKHAAAEELFSAIREVLRGRAYVTPLVSGALLNSFLTQTPARRSRFPGQLSPRQREVLQLVAEGHQNKEIAEALHISVTTVAYHKSQIMESLGIHTTAGLTKFAIDHGIVAR